MREGIEAGDPGGDTHQACWTEAEQVRERGVSLGRPPPPRTGRPGRFLPSFPGTV